MMDLKTRDVGTVTIVEVHGKLVGGPDNTDKFHEYFGALLDEGKRKFVMNLQHTPWSDSQGIALLLGAHTGATKDGGNVVLAHVNDRITSILSVMKLLPILQIFDDEEKAVDFVSENA